MCNTLPVSTLNPSKPSIFFYFQYIQWGTIFAIIPVCIACLGIILTLISFGILIKYADTPLVRASGRELCYVILGGILLCYLNTFILLAKPGMVVCALQR